MDYTPDLLCDPKELDEIDPATTAHLCIDVQRAYFKTRVDEHHHGKARDVAKNIARIKPLFNRAGLCKTFMIHHTAVEKEFFFVQPSEEEGDIVLPKDYFSSFFRTGLDESLKSMGVRSLILSGGYTTECVQETASDGLTWGYDVFVLADCIFSPSSRLTYDASLKDVFTSHAGPLKHARFTTADAILHKLRGIPDSPVPR